MTLRLLISLNLLLALIGARAETADDFFHGGAMNYFSNNVSQALAVVTNGRAQFPDDMKLKKLEELLKQQQQQQDQQKQDQDKKEQQQQDQKNQQQKDQQKKDGTQQESEKPKPQQSKPDKQKSEQQHQAKATPAGQMTPEQARRLLDAQKGEESALVFRPPAKPKDESKPLKDW